MPDQSTYKESIDSIGPSEAGFGLEGGRASITFKPVDNANFVNKVQEIIGFSRVGSSGKLERGLPKAHPQFPWLFGSHLSSIKGVGAPSVMTASDPLQQLEAEAFDDYALYPQYSFTVEFTPRPYVLAKDDKIPTEAVSFLGEDGSTTYNRTVANEWLRYTDYDYQPLSEYLTAQQGQFLFRTDSGAAPGGNPASSATPAGTGQIRMLSRKVGIKFRWYCVPYEVLDRDDDDNWILQGLGCVNLTRFYRWAAGTLLFRGVSYRRYTPSVPEVAPLFDTTSIVFTNNKLCDLEFDFLYVNPTIKTAATTHKKNNNVIQAGHNLAPHGALQGYYYVSTEIPSVTAVHNQPIYPGYEFKCLFCVPNA